MRRSSIERLLNMSKLAVRLPMEAFDLSIILFGMCCSEGLEIKQGESSPARRCLQEIFLLLLPHSSLSRSLDERRRVIFQCSLVFSMLYSELISGLPNTTIF